MQPTTQNNLAKPLTIAGILVVIAGIIGFTSMAKDGESQQATSTPSEPATSDSNETINPDSSIETSNKYKDGTYTVDGDYISPGGAEKVGVSVTLKDDVVVASNFTVKAERPISVQMQNQFAAGYKAFVIGKKLDDIAVEKVSGSSLTPKGFNDAIAKIRVEAQS